MRRGRPSNEAPTQERPWAATYVLIDAPLFLFGGPMKMSAGAYFADIGLTYVAIPVVTWGLAVAYRAGRAAAPAVERVS